MVDRVFVSPRADRDFRRLPRAIVSKLKTWVEAVETEGLEATRRIPGYHDEPLKGRRRGQRSIRLSRGYRAIYVVLAISGAELVRIDEVTKHAY